MPINRFNLSDLVSIQRKSFFNLLEQGLIEEIEKINPIRINKNKKIVFYPKHYKMTRPEYTPQDAIKCSASYTSKLFVPVLLQTKTKNTDNSSVVRSLTCWMYIGDIPLMTKQGHFIFNGGARIIVNQVLRSPGVHFKKKEYNISEARLVVDRPSPISPETKEKVKNTSHKTIDFVDPHMATTQITSVYADFICFSGTWLRLEMDKEKRIWAKLKNTPKLPIYWLLLAMGLSDKIIFQKIQNPSQLLKVFINVSTSSILKRNKARARSRKNARIVPRGDYNPFYKLYIEYVEQIRTLYKLKPTDLIYSNLGSNTSKKDKDKDKDNTEYRRSQYTNHAPVDLNPKSSNNAFSSGLNARIGSNDGSNHAPVLSFEFTETPIQAWQAIYNKLYENKALNENTVFNVNNENNVDQNQTVLLGRRFVYNRFMNPRTYDLGKPGRLALNRKLGLTVALTQTTLTGLDVLYATDYLMKVEQGIYKPDDVDNLKNRRVRTAGELIKTQVGVGLFRLYISLLKAIEQLTSTAVEPDDSIIVFALFDPAKQKKRSKGFNSAMHEFFGTNSLSQYLDQINPLSELTHKRRLSSMGDSGVTAEAATITIRGIHPSHYGRVCPVETPEGINTGLVNSLTTYSCVYMETDTSSNRLASLKSSLVSPYYQVYKGQVQKNRVFLLNAEQEECVKLAAADINVSYTNFLPKSLIPVRVHGDFIKIQRQKVQYISVSPLQMISVAASLIPFIEHDDANRALMGSNMMRQAVPIIRPERPIVTTGLEARTVSDSGHALVAQYSGIVTYVSAKRIVINRI